MNKVGSNTQGCHTHARTHTRALYVRMRAVIWFRVRSKILPWGVIAID